MATNSSKTPFPEFFAEATSAESVRRQFIEAPLEGARQSAFNSALELAGFFGLLPDAFAASQRRELERLKKSATENDPRVAALEASIEQADVLRTMARRGSVRAQRSLVAVASGKQVFHGFVSDSDLNPLADLTVRLAGAGETSRDFSSTTDEEGYFSIPLGKRGASSFQAQEITPEHLAELFAQQQKESAFERQPGLEGKSVRVEILKNDKVIEEDPLPIALDQGSVYREYVISEKGTSSFSDFGG